MKRFIIGSLGFLFTLLTLADLVYAQQDEERTFDGHHLFPKINPINPNLVAYEYRGNIEIVDKSQNNVVRFTIPCQEVEIEENEFDSFFGNIQTGSSTPEHHYFDCAYFDWRPTLDYMENYWFAFTSEVDRALRVGYINSDFLCYDFDDSLGDFITLDCSYYDVIKTSGNERLTRPKWSPDGQRLLFNQGNSLQLTGPLYEHIRKKNFSGVASRELTRHAWYQAWSHDGRYIAYEYSPAGQDAGEMYIMDIRHSDGAGSPGSIRNIRDYIIQTRAAPAEGRYKPNWSASGKYLTYLVPSAIDDRWDVKVMQIVRDRHGAMENLVSITAGQARVFARNVFRSPHELRDGFPVTMLPTSSGETPEVLLVIAADQDLNNPVRVYPIDDQRIRAGMEASGRDLSREQEIGTIQNDLVNVVYDGRVTHISYVSQVDGALRLQHIMIDEGRVSNRWRAPAEQVTAVPRDLSRNSATLRSALVPGLGQIYKGETGKGLLHFGITAAAVTGVAMMVSKNNNDVNNFEVLKKNNTGSITSGTVDAIQRGYGERFEAWNALNKEYDNITINRIFIGAGIAAVAGIYAWSIMDSRSGFPIWKDRDGSRNRLSMQPVVIPQPERDTFAASMRFRLNLN